MFRLEKLDTKVLARNVIEYKEIDSTQKEVWRRIKKNDIKNGTLIIADMQTDGIGTHGRKWYGTEKGSIQFSIVLCPKVNVKKLNNITIEIANIIIEIFEELYKIKLDIKEPNDIMYNGKKIGGILTETKLNQGIVKYLVVGVGINTNKTYFEEEIKSIASSIVNEFGIKVNNEEIIAEFCNKLEEKIDRSIG